MIHLTNQAIYEVILVILVVNRVDAERLVARHRSFFGANNLTLADIVAGTTVPQLPLIGVTLDDYPKLSAWSDRLMQRETWVKTQPSQEELEAFI
ncbi:MAG: glutathione S-transferase family protein, partial [Nostoc sp. C3-bin3]|nr:glutathione S-transferase family protein [Nostoc sp. C3-bin3]